MPPETGRNQANARLIAELLAALRGMERAAQEIAAEFIDHKRAANWEIINDAYIATARAVTNATGRSKRE